MLPRFEFAFVGIKAGIRILYYLCIGLHGRLFAVYLQGLLSHT